MCSHCTGGQRIMKETTADCCAQQGEDHFAMKIERFPLIDMRKELVSAVQWTYAPCLKPRNACSHPKYVFQTNFP